LKDKEDEAGTNKKGFLKDKREKHLNNWTKESIAWKVQE
jgi:hypothetical protein